MSQTAATFDEILAQVRELDPIEQANLLEELAGMVKQQLAERKKRNILELEGLDAREYVRKERASWEVRRHNEGRLL